MKQIKQIGSVFLVIVILLYPVFVDRMLHTRMDRLKKVEEQLSVISSDQLEEQVIVYQKGKPDQKQFPTLFSSINGEVHYNEKGISYALYDGIFCLQKEIKDTKATMHQQPKELCNIKTEWSSVYLQLKEKDKENVLLYDAKEEWDPILVYNKEDANNYVLLQDLCFRMHSILKNEAIKLYYVGPSVSGSCPISTSLFYDKEKGIQSSLLKIMLEKKIGENSFDVEDPSLDIFPVFYDQKGKMFVLTKEDTLKSPGINWNSIHVWEDHQMVLNSQDPTFGLVVVLKKDHLTVGSGTKKDPYQVLDLLTNIK